MASYASPELALVLGARIRALRAELNVLQRELAVRCDLDNGYLSQLESGKHLPSLEVLRRLAVGLGVEMMDLVAVDATSPRTALLDGLRRKNRSSVGDALSRLGVTDQVEQLPTTGT